MLSFSACERAWTSHSNSSMLGKVTTQLLLSVLQELGTFLTVDSVWHLCYHHSRVWHEGFKAGKNLSLDTSSLKCAQGLSDWTLLLEISSGRGMRTITDHTLIIGQTLYQAPIAIYTDFHNSVNWGTERVGGLPTVTQQPWKEAETMVFPHLDFWIHSFH